MRALIVACVWLALGLLPLPAAAAVRPADGDWQASDNLGPWPQVVYFTVEGNGTRVTATNGLIGDPTSCGWAGRWSQPDDVAAISGGSFSAHATGAADTNPDQLQVAGRFTSRSTATLTFTLTCQRSQGLITHVSTFAATTDAPPPAHCATARLSGGALQLGASGGARAHPKRFRHRAAIRIRRRHADCAEVERVMDGLLRARDESASLARSGYVMTRVKRLRLHGRRAYRVSARRDIGIGAGGIAYVREGSLRIDHSIYRAGQQLLFSDEPTKHLLSPCTAGFVVTDPAWGLSGLSAGHCGADGIDNAGLPVLRAYSRDAQRSQLGSVLRAVQEPGLDAIEFAIYGRWGVAQQIERGERPPLTVLGAASDLSIGRGTKVCFAGRTSGAQNCGRVKGFKQHLRCTSVKARPGDSGGPVYTDPGEGLTTYAVGIVTTARMCFTPLSRALGRFGATFPTGTILR